MDFGNFARHASRAEGLVTVAANAGHAFGGDFEVFAWVKVRLVLRKVAANRTCGCHAQIGIDIDFTDTVFDAFDDF